jgi:rubredoxin
MPVKHANSDAASSKIQVNTETCVHVQRSAAVVQQKQVCPDTSHTEMSLQCAQATCNVHKASFKHIRVA